MISHLEIPVTPEEEEAWTLFLKKYENLNFSPIKTLTTDIEEDKKDGIFGQSVRSL